MLTKWTLNIFTTHLPPQSINPIQKPTQAQPNSTPDNTQGQRDSQTHFPLQIPPPIYHHLQNHPANTIITSPLNPYTPNTPFQKFAACYKLSEVKQHPSCNLLFPAKTDWTNKIIFSHPMVTSKGGKSSEGPQNPNCWLFKEPEAEK